MKNATILVLSLAAALAADGQNAGETGRQLFRANCQACHGPQGDNVPGVDFRSGQFRHASSDDELASLILSGIPGTAMPPSNLPEASRRALVAYLRSMHAAEATAVAGNAAHGREIFEGKGGCLDCHRVLDRGSRVGPDLSDAGARQDAQALEESIVAPGKAMLPQHRFARVVLKDGSTLSGRRLNEDTYSIELIDSRERLVSIARSDVREYTLLPNSPMPSYREKLSAAEIADVVAYLASLRGVQ